MLCLLVFDQTVEQYNLLRTKELIRRSTVFLSRDSLWGGALRDDTKNGCVADYSRGEYCRDTRLL